MLKIILLFTVSVIASGSTSYFYKRLTCDSPHRSYFVLASAAWMFPVSLLFFVVSTITGGFAPTYKLTAVALLSGCAAAAATYMLLESLRKGSYTTAIIIINMNFYIPILFSRLFLGEKATLLQLTGILLATVVIIVINIKAKADRPKDNLSGIISACIACLANGMVNFGIKLQQYYTPGEGQNTFFSLTYFFAAVISLLLFFILKEKAEKQSKSILQFSKIKKLLIPALWLGVCMPLCYYPQSILSGMPEINAAAQFTVTITGSLILSLVIGWILYKEKVTITGILSLMLCSLAIVFQVLSY
ncbi:MAG: EamA family transporter [Eubacteriales bacterium]